MKKKIFLIYTAAFVMAIALNGLLLGMVFHASEVFKASPSQVGYLTSCYCFNYLMACVLARPLVARLTPLRNLLVATGSISLGMALASCAPNIAVAFAAMSLAGIGTAFFWPPLMGWLSEGLEGKSLSRITGFYNFSWSTGTIVAPVIIGYLSAKSSRYSLIFTTVCSVMMFVFFLIFGRASGGDARGNASASASGGGHESFLRYPSWLGLLCAWFSVGLVGSIYPLAAEEVLKYTRPEIGNVLMFRALAVTLAMTALGMLTFWQFKAVQLLLGHLLLAISIFLLGYAQSRVTVTMLVVITGLMAGHAYTNSIFHGVAGSRDRTLRMTIHEMLLSIGQVCGSAVGGIVYQHYGIKWACALSAIIMLMPVAFDALCIIKKRSIGF